MGNEDGFVYIISLQFPEALHQLLHGSLPAPHLADGHQTAFMIDMDHGLDAQHAAHEGSGRADPAAPLQVIQIIDGDLVADVVFHFFHPGGQRFQAQALVPFPAGIVDQQTLAQGGTEGIYNDDPPLGIFFHQILRGNDGALVRGA